MKKLEFVYREILYCALEEKNNVLTQLGLSKKLKLSLSTVNYALKPLKNMAAIEIKLKNFRVIDPKKILYYWASLRTLEKDIIYKTRVDKPVRQIESEAPAEAVFGMYSAYKYRLKNVPADYSEVYVYGECEEIKRRFPQNGRIPNLFVLKKDEFLKGYGKTTTLAQTFVDLWNLKEWYAKEFLIELEKRIGV